MSRGLYFEWKDGVPVPIRGETPTPLSQKTLAMLVANIPYEPKRDETGNLLPGESKFQNSDGTWMPCAQVAQMRRIQLAAEGDYEALRQWEDRVLGKPKQQVESVSVTGTFQDWLQILVNEEQEQAQKTQITIQPAQETGPSHSIEIPQSSVKVSQDPPDMDWL